jgi:iron complex transport system permease protein
MGGECQHAQEPSITDAMLGRRAIWICLGCALIVAFLLHLMFGTSGFIWPGRIYASLFTGGEWTSEDEIIRNLRLIRAIASVLVGVSLGMAGSALQSLFKNPLADPYVAGVSSGAAVGGALAFVFSLTATFGYLGMVVGATAGGAISLALVMSLATRRRTLVPERLLLAGVMVGSILSAILSMVLLAAGEDTNRVMHWLLGSLASVGEQDLVPLLVGLVIGAPALIFQAKKLNILALGSDAARRAGVKSGRLSLHVLLATTLMVSVTVGIVGIVGFLGLVSPHIARKLVGVDWRQALIASGLVGGIVLSLADVVAQLVVKGADLPVGIVTAIIGAPFLLILLKRD